MRTLYTFFFLLSLFSTGLSFTGEWDDLKRLNDSTIIFFNNGNYQDALKCSQRVVIITKDLYGAEDINYAKSLINFAKINESIGRYTIAESAYLQSAEIIK